MLKFLDKLIFPQPPVTINPNQIKQGEFKEHPKVAELREKAKAKMEEWGCQTLLEGRKFSLHNTVLVNKKKPKKTRARKK